MTTYNERQHKMYLSFINLTSFLTHSLTVYILLCYSLNFIAFIHHN